jgi:hypothetical protein
MDVTEPAGDCKGLHGMRSRDAGAAMGDGSNSESLLRPETRPWDAAIATADAAAHRPPARDTVGRGCRWAVDVRIDRGISEGRLPRNRSLPGGGTR